MSSECNKLQYEGINMELSMHHIPTLTKKKRRMKEPDSRTKIKKIFYYTIRNLQEEE